jgi:predicted NAD/FAD-dependent oxidoreductase
MTVSGDIASTAANALLENAGFTVLTMEKQKGFRAHLVARKMKRIDFETEP